MLFDPFFLFRSKKCVHAMLLLRNPAIFYLSGVGVHSYMTSLNLFVHQLTNFYYPLIQSMKATCTPRLLKQSLRY